MSVQDRPRMHRRPARLGSTSRRCIHPVGWFTWADIARMWEAAQATVAIARWENDMDLPRAQSTLAGGEGGGQDEGPMQLRTPLARPGKTDA